MAYDEDGGNQVWGTRTPFSVEEVGTGVPQALPSWMVTTSGGHHTTEGAICKHRHFWLITETISTSHPMHRATQQTHCSI